jgi:hypothetical protein
LAFDLKGGLDHDTPMGAKQPAVAITQRERDGFVLFQPAYQCRQRGGQWGKGVAGGRGRGLLACHAGASPAVLQKKRGGGRSVKHVRLFEASL